LSYTIEITHNNATVNVTSVGSPSVTVHADDGITYIDEQIAALVGSANSSFDTLGEVQDQVALKANKAGDTFTGTMLVIRSLALSSLQSQVFREHLSSI
jgi:hypothetical protein